MDKFVIKKQYPEVKTFKHIHIHENAYNDLKELCELTGNSFVDLVDAMVCFCSERLEIIEEE